MAEILWSEGYWVRTSVKVNLTKDDKEKISRTTSPRWELDVVGYKAFENQLLILECKSFLDSSGVHWNDVCGDSNSKRYKLFREEILRNTVLDRLCAQMTDLGSCAAGVTAQLGLVAGKVRNGDDERLENDFERKGWMFWGPKTLRKKFEDLANSGYENQVATVAAKILRT